MGTERKPVLDEQGKPMQRAQPGYYAGFSTMRQKGYWDAATRALVEKRVAKNNPAHPEALKFFSVDEGMLMRAVVERVLPQEDRTAERRIDVLAGMDERLAANKIEGYRYEDMPPDGEAYRIACRAFAQMSVEIYGKAFVELETRQQEELLQQVHDGEPLAAQSVWAEMNVERFWTMLVSDCCSVYYAHPWAWDEIGFGGPAYPRGYMRLEEGEPEPWEVREQRYVWKAPVDTISDEDAATGKGEQSVTHPGQGGTH